jgi:succinate-semialdehyde dehydrogenase / glutarate-semialdehyde dehydrogenase
MLIPSKNPSRNYALIGSVEATDPLELPRIVERSHRAQKSWKTTSLDKRGEIALDMGMPIRQARDEVAYGMMYMRWYIDHAVEYLSPAITRETPTELHTLYYEPRWVVVAIAPWNYPFSMCIWTCIQALLAGNSVIFKTSKECILTGRLIADIFAWSDLPEWVWTEIYGSGDLWDALMREDIDFVTFTGSTRVGEWLALKSLEKSIGCVMELGGSAPGIICSDADIDSIIETVYFLRYSNSGQMCDGLKRLIVHESRYDEVVERLSVILLSKTIWDASLETTDIGPVVSESQKVAIENQYRDAIDKWASVLARLDIPEWLEWAYFAPALLGNITPDMAVWREEVFGPILPIVTFSTIEEAISLANDTEYGLGAYVFTEDRDLFAQVAREIESGMVQMNTLNYCIPESPFGGYKKSWIGREHGKWGFHEFCNIKVTSMPKK